MTPETPLLAQTTYRVRLAAGLADASGRPLAGGREFRFTTVPPAPARLAGAQLYSEAPGVDGQARVVATAGFAEGGAAVLFVNTGEAGGGARTAAGGVVLRLNKARTRSVADAGTSTPTHFSDRLIDLFLSQK